ncbi:transglutaminase-like domain-containing protein [Variovorax sp. PvP013]|jgi:transglutaminase-like putative cysteine protease|uniref:transglutaminase-like domain-containing protein n=1 Tax=Variovorax sp. PvP013 TaxID=3156435 RepID=UPI003D232D4D
MKLKANCTMTVKAGADCPVVAMLRPRSGLAQWMISERYELEPWVRTVEYVDSYGNLGQRFVIPQGEMRIEVEMVMETEDDIRVTPGAPRTLVEDLPDDALLYLLQSRYCPSDKMEAKAMEIVGDATPGYDQVEAIRAWIHDNLDYRYGVSNGTTDALDSLAHGAGVCRDFSHIGVALTRALKIPARMVVGYLHKLDPMDMHAWFEAFVDGRWYTFDATQSEPRGGRIVVAYGRDAADVAFVSNYGPLEMGEMKVTVDLIEPSQTGD